MDSITQKNKAMTIEDKMRNIKKLQLEINKIFIFWQENLL